MAFSRRHYEAIAAIIRNRHQVWGSAHPQSINLNAAKACETLANDLADLFAADNPRFDRDRFLSACGLKD